MEDKPVKANNQVKVLEHLSDIYIVENKHENEHTYRYESIMQRFQKNFGMKPQFFVRSPAVAQLLSLDPVLSSISQSASICIEQDIILCVSKSQTDQIVIQNLQSSLYQIEKLSTDPQQKFFEENAYINQFLLGFKSALSVEPVQKSQGMNILVDYSYYSKTNACFQGQLAIASCLATLMANGVKMNIDKIIANIKKFKKVLENNEDTFIEQTILQGERLCVYQFNQQLQEVDTFKLPTEGMCFIIANSLTPEAIMMTGGQRQELRTCEYRIALALLMSKLGMKLSQDVKTIFELQQVLQYSLEDMVSIVKSNIEDHVYTTKEIEQLTGTKLQSILQDIPYYEKVMGVNREFKPLKKIMHVLQESIRIEQLKEVLGSASSSQEKWAKIAQILTESQRSIENNLESTSKEIQALIKTMELNGCQGIRVLGSGWGGSVISLVPEQKADSIVSEIMNGFYMNKENQLMISDYLEFYVYKTHSSTGSVILDPQYEIWFC